MACSNSSATADVSQLSIIGISFLKLIPLDIMSKGAVLIPLFISLYCFTSISILCEDYLVPSVKIIGDKLNLKRDVTGATVLAAATSFPDFLIGLLALLDDSVDIGFGSMLGATMFNLMFVIGIVGVVHGAKKQHLSSFPIFRDSLFFLIALLVLFGIVRDGAVYWYETLALVSIYLLYIVGIHFSTKYQEKICSTFSSCCFIYNNDTADLGESEIIEMKNAAKDEDTPKLESILITAWRTFCIPIQCIFYITIPDCKKENRQYLVIFTLTSVCIWMTIISYVVLDMLTIFGITFSIPQAILGITILAAGSSSTDAFTGLVLGREGKCDMMVSNLFGSNIFDLVIGLGVPWTLYTIALHPNEPLILTTKTLFIDTLLVLLCCLLLIVMIATNKWILDKLLGVFSLIIYTGYLIAACLLSLNVFGNLDSSQGCL